MRYFGTLRLDELARRLGAREPVESAIESDVQPVLMVGDVSALVSPPRAPEAFGGWTRAALAGNHSAWYVAPRAPGGCRVSATWFAIGANAYFQFSFLNAVPALAASTSPTLVQMDAADPVRSVLVEGHANPRNLAVDVHPILPWLGISGAYPPSLDLWVPPGRVLYVEGYAAAQGMSAYVRMRDLPAPRPA